MLSSLINQHDIRGLKYLIVSGSMNDRLNKSIDLIENLI